jgi:NAD(P)-dependent dehydrogenase (short-subunit alcohol dehydrogenase family)
MQAIKTIKTGDGAPTSAWGRQQAHVGKCRFEGSIINILCGGSLRGYHRLGAYGASKVGVDTLTQYAAASFGKDNVRCNAVCPGFHLSAAVIAETPKERLKNFEEHVSLPRLGMPDYIVKVVAILASDDSYYMNSQILQVDGGLLDHAPHLSKARKAGEFCRKSRPTD